MYRKRNPKAAGKIGVANKLSAISCITIHPYYFSWQKRVFDVSISGIAFVVGFPFLVAIAAAVLFFSGPPIFFGQKRVGKGKKPFVMWKFRTMELNAAKEQKKYLRYNEAPAPMFKMRNDPRYTRIGKFLSATGVDELPQLWNILRGEMSVVGPRPLPMKEARLLNNSWQFRYQIKPGIVSEWAIDQTRYQSLAKWQTLEKNTLTHGDIVYDFSLITRTFFYLAR